MYKIKNRYNFVNEYLVDWDTKNINNLVLDAGAGERRIKGIFNIVPAKQIGKEAQPPMPNINFGLDFNKKINDFKKAVKILKNEINMFFLLNGELLIIFILFTNLPSMNFKPL